MQKKQESNCKITAQFAETLLKTELQKQFNWTHPKFVEQISCFSSVTFKKQKHCTFSSTAQKPNHKPLPTNLSGISLRL